MAYGVYFRGKNERAYKRAQEWVVPTKKAKWTCNGKIHRDVSCETLEEAKELERKYILKGFETKIKEVK